MLFFEILAGKYMCICNSKYYALCEIEGNMIQKTPCEFCGTTYFAPKSSAILIYEVLSPSYSCLKDKLLQLKNDWYTRYDIRYDEKIIKY